MNVLSDFSQQYAAFANAYVLIAKVGRVSSLYDGYLY